MSETDIQTPVEYALHVIEWNEKRPKDGETLRFTDDIEGLSRAFLRLRYLLEEEPCFCDQLKKGIHFHDCPQQHALELLEIPAVEWAAWIRGMEGDDE